MGKIHCEACKKSCKGQAIKLQEHYYHVKCFKCKECKKQLAAGGFYTREDSYYCADDYQRLFGTRCQACGKFVEGEVVTALGNTYHPTCFQCTKCNQYFGPGDKVTFTGKEYLCNTCLEQTLSEATTPASQAPSTAYAADSEGGGSPSKKARPPVASSTPARPANAHLVDGNLGSPMSDTSDFSEMKENMINGPETHVALMSPISTTSGYKSDTSDPDNIEDKEKLSPIQNIMQYRSRSPAASTVSRSSKKSRESSESYRSRFEVDYGKFYNVSYLDNTKSDYKKGPSINPNLAGKTHYHRPENFSYTQVRRDFIKPLKKDGATSGDNNKYVLQKKEPLPPLMKNKEAIDMARYPEGERHEGLARTAPIDREDWPAPPDPAAAYPELLREKPKRKKRGGGSGYTTATETEGEATETEVETEGEEVDGPELDPKIKREIDELTKLGNSGAAKALLEDFKKKRSESPTLDPISASRAPAADHEPPFKTRYESPIFASPSRDLDYRPRLYSMDDGFLSRKYRTLLPTSNFPVPKPGYGLAGKSSLRSSDAASREAGYFSDTGMLHSMKFRMPNAMERNGYHTDATTDDEVTRRSYETDTERATRRSHALTDDESARRSRTLTDDEATRRSHVTDDETTRRSFYSSQSSFDEPYDPTTGLRKSRLRSSAASERSVPSYHMGYKRSVASIYRVDEPPKIYPYEQLKLSNFSLPPDVESNSLERHLSKEEFESIFHMSREEFYRSPEWKRNDMKSRVQLF